MAESSITGKWLLGAFHEGWHAVICPPDGPSMSALVRFVIFPST